MALLAFDTSVRDDFLVTSALGRALDVDLDGRSDLTFRRSGSGYSIDFANRYINGSGSFLVVGKKA